MLGSEIRIYLILIASEILYRSVSLTVAQKLSLTRSLPQQRPLMLFQSVYGHIRPTRQLEY